MYIVYAFMQINANLLSHACMHICIHICTILKFTDRGYDKMVALILDYSDNAQRLANTTGVNTQTALMFAAQSDTQSLQV